MTFAQLAGWSAPLSRYLGFVFPNLCQQGVPQPTRSQQGGLPTSLASAFLYVFFRAHPEITTLQTAGSVKTKKPLRDFGNKNWLNPRCHWLLSKWLKFSF